MEVVPGQYVLVAVTDLGELEPLQPEGELPQGRSGELIIVAEDEDRVRETTVETLRELGYTVVHASDGRAALEALDLHGGASLLLSDVVMPDMKGQQLADEARKRHPQLKVLFTTGYTRNAIVHDGRLDRGVAVLPKPFSVAQLARAVRRELER